MIAKNIKFMAWNKETKKFVKSHQLIDPYNMPVTPTRQGFKLKSVFELFMSSNLNDTANKEIYEGHILEVSYYPNLHRTFVSYEDGAFRVDMGDEVKTLSEAIGEWHGMDATISIVGHIKTHKI